MLIAAGPDLAAGLTSDLPSGNVDLAPTILALLGVDSPPKMDGRVLVEAMKNRRSSEAQGRTIDAEARFKTGTWRQHLRVSSVETTQYLDEGNGGFER